MKAQSRCDIEFRGILVCNIYVGDNSAYYNMVGFDSCVGGGGGRIMIAGREKISRESQTVVIHVHSYLSCFLGVVWEISNSSKGNVWKIRIKMPEKG